MLLKNTVHAHWPDLTTTQKILILNLSIRLEQNNYLLASIRHWSIKQPDQEQNEMYTRGNV